MYTVVGVDQDQADVVGAPLKRYASADILVHNLLVPPSIVVDPGHLHGYCVHGVHQPLEEGHVTRVWSHDVGGERQTVWVPNPMVMVRERHT